MSKFFDWCCCCKSSTIPIVAATTQEGSELQTLNSQRESTTIVSPKAKALIGNSDVRHETLDEEPVIVRDKPRDDNELNLDNQIEGVVVPQRNSLRN